MIGGVIPSERGGLSWLATSVSNNNPLVDDNGEAKDMDSAPSSNTGGNNPHAPALAPKPSLSEADEATPQPPKQKRNRRKGSKTKATPPTTLDQMFGIQSETWTRYHTLTIDGDVDNVEVYSDLKKKLSDDFECFRRADNSIMVDAKTMRNAEKVEKILKIHNTDASTSRDPRLNSVRGTVLVPLSEFRNSENLEHRILNHLQEQNIPVSKVNIFTKTSRRGKELLFASITFESRVVPPKIRIGFKKVEVREDIPKPRQCQVCWKFGHPAKYCTSAPCCPICGKANHNLSTCPHKGEHTYKGHCPNCDTDGHTALSKQCDLYMKENEILAVMYRQGISKGSAKEIVAEAGMFVGVSYARRVAQPNATGNTPKQPQQSPEQNENEERQTPAQPQNQEPETRPDQVDAMMSSMFGDNAGPFLSVEAESADQGSSEEPQSQVFTRGVLETGQKRKTEEAFSASPTEKDQTSRRRLNQPPLSHHREEGEEEIMESPGREPLATSSPTKYPNILKTPEQELGEEPRALESPSPMSRSWTRPLEP